MTTRRTRIVRGPSPRPGFLWRGLLIVLPVVVLAVFGFLSLRQDRQLTEAEVRERARQFSDEAADRCWKQLMVLPETDLANPTSANSIKPQAGVGLLQISAAGELMTPADYPVVPAPNPCDASQLRAESAVLWRGIEMDVATNALHTTRIAGLRSFLATDPPSEFAAWVHFRLAALLRQTDAKESSKEYLTVIDKFPASVGETGLPLAPLARLRRAELAIDSSGGGASDIRAALNDLASNAVAQPSMLSPALLAQVARWEQQALATNNVAGYWQDVWDLAELQRHLFRSMRRTVSNLAPGGRLDPVKSWPEIFWFHHKDSSIGGSEHEPNPWLVENQTNNWLAMRERTLENGSCRYRYFSLRQLTQMMAAFGQAEKALPEYLGVYYQLAGRSFGGFRGDSLKPGEGAPPKQLLSSATHWSAAGTPLLIVSVALVDPAALYARQHQRVLWFGALIAVSAIVALVGLVSTWSAFQRQQRLYEQQSNFVSSVTHELRAPIGAVRLMAENLQRGKVSKPAEQRQFFDYIVQECCRLSAMIENVLNLARIEQGRQEYEFEPVDVVRLVENVVKLMEPNATEAQLTLHLQLDRSQFSASKECPVLDSRALQQALINLIDNALKHSPPGSTVTVGLERASHLRIWVADQGPGIPLREHQRIFERFYRLGSELRRETPGVGIGLSIVKHIADAHHGKVWVESEVGKGSRFVLELPIHQPTLKIAS